MQDDTLPIDVADLAARCDAYLYTTCTIPTKHEVCEVRQVGPLSFVAVVKYIDGSRSATAEASAKREDAEAAAKAACLLAVRKAFKAAYAG